jgi:hypothetical protein
MGSHTTCNNFASGGQSYRLGSECGYLSFWHPDSSELCNNSAEGKESMPIACILDTPGMTQKQKEKHDE